jgi:uroporphyrinogen decarboxylase
VDAKAVAAMPDAADDDVLAPVYESIRLVRNKLDRKHAVIGFCGAPWSVASYMIEGGSSPDRAKARRVAVERPEWFSDLVDRLIRNSVTYLCGQAAAGAEVLQIFDSWAGDLPEFALEELVFDPVRRIVDGVRRQIPGVLIIGFARGIGVSHLAFAKECGLNAVSVESNVPVEWLRDEVAPHVAIQGNLDPMVLAVGGAALERSARRLLSVLPAHGHIMNLGHGILPTTPVAHVSRLVEIVRAADQGQDG